MMDTNSKLHILLQLLADEIGEADYKHSSYSSAHEGYAVLLEEVDELKAHVWAKEEHRNVLAMRDECVQIAAVALRFARDLT